MLRVAFTDNVELQIARRAIKQGDKALLSPQLRRRVLKLMNMLIDVATDDVTVYEKVRKAFKDGVYDDIGFDSSDNDNT